MGLKINEDKTRYLFTSRRIINEQNINIDHYSFEQVDNFKHLGIIINSNNNMHNKINIRISAANQRYFAMNRIFKSRL